MTHSIETGSVLNGRYVVVQVTGNTIIAADQRLVGRMWRIVAASADDEEANPAAIDRFETGGQWYEVFSYNSAKSARDTHSTRRATVVGEVFAQRHDQSEKSVRDTPPAQTSRTVGRKPSRVEWLMTGGIGLLVLLALVIFLAVLNKPADNASNTGARSPKTDLNNAVPLDGRTISVAPAVQATMTSIANDLNMVNATIAVETPMPTSSLTTNSDGAHDGTSWPTFGGGLDQTRVSKTGPKLPAQLLWNYDATRTATGTQDIKIYGAAAIGSDGIAYFGTTSGALVALDPAGKLLWTAKTGDAIVAAPAIGSNGVIYVGSTDNSLYAFDKKDGRKLWAFPTFGELDAAPVVFEGVVYVGSLDGNLWAVDAQSGAKRWNFTTDKGIAQTPGIVASPTIYSGLIYIGSVGGKMYALDKTGKVKWTVEANSTIFGSAAIVGGILYFGAENGHIYANDAATGTHKWEVTVPGKIRTSPAVVGTMVYIGSGDNTLYAYDSADGSLKWKYATGAPISASPVVANYNGDLTQATVYVGSTDRSIYGINAQTGQKVWSYTSSNIVLASPAIAGTRLVIGSTDGHIYAFGSP